MKRRPTFLKILPALGLALGVAMLGGCAQPARQLQPDVAASHHWSGRMALQVQDAQQQSFSAGFELQGQPESGTLLVFNPLGSIMARLQWTRAGATLQQGDQITQSDSLPELITRMTGSDIPVAALFDWLQGKPTPAQGWEADLAAYGDGKITAQRLYPQPEASLRIVIERS